MKVIIIIPARYASVRYEGKPLAKLRGASGEARTLIERSIIAARSVRGPSEIYVATDDARIEQEAERHGCSVIMTSPACRNGTERCAEAFNSLHESADLIINLQGDAPLTPGRFVEALIKAFADDGALQVATPVLACDQEGLQALRGDRQAGRVGATTAVMNGQSDALYFSKEVLPYSDQLRGDNPPVFHHVGLYGYRPEALAAYAAHEPSQLELIEGLEQLRFLEMGIKIRCVKLAAEGAKFWELNNPEDVPRIESYLKAMGWE